MCDTRAYSLSAINTCTKWQGSSTFQTGNCFYRVVTIFRFRLHFSTSVLLIWGWRDAKMTACVHSWHWSCAKTFKLTKKHELGELNVRQLLLESHNNPRYHLEGRKETGHYSSPWLVVLRFRRHALIRSLNNPNTHTRGNPRSSIKCEVYCGASSFHSVTKKARQKHTATVLFNELLF